MKEMAESIARGMNAEAEMIWEANGYPPIMADAALVDRLAPSLARVAGDKARVMEPQLGRRGLFLLFPEGAGDVHLRGRHLAGTREAAPNHSPRFQVDEAGLITGLRATLHVVADYTGSGVQT